MKNNSNYYAGAKSSQFSRGTQRACKRATGLCLAVEQIVRVQNHFVNMRNGALSFYEIKNEYGNHSGVKFPNRILI